MKSLSVLAIVLTAFTMSAGMAHTLELRPKIKMDGATYLATQQIYRGWAFIGIVFIAALIVNALLAWQLRAAREPWLAAAVGAVATLLALAVFLGFTFPVNRATENWTKLPANWEALRLRWEYSHALDATFLFIALIAVAIAVSGRRPS